LVLGCILSLSFGGLVIAIYQQDQQKGKDTAQAVLKMQLKDSNKDLAQQVSNATSKIKRIIPFAYDTLDVERL
jgi:hypothetical protein